LHRINLNKWEIQTGIRFNTVNVQFKEATLGDISVKSSSLVGDLGLSYKLSINQLIYSSIANGYRSPNIDDMGTLGIVDFRYEIPAYNLKPEKSLTYELGYKYFSPKFIFNVTAYYMQLKDIIARVKIDGKVIEGYNVYNKTNYESAYIKGFEISLDKKIGAHFKWSSNTTYTYGQNLTKNEPMRRIPPMFGQNTLSWFKNKTSIMLSHQYAGTQNRLAQGDKDDNRIGKLGTPQWNLFNVVSTYTLKHLEIQMGLLNLLNEKYKTHGSGIYGMGRAVNISVKFML
jgi:outer membrane receptor protein involved in Fe transport